MVQNRFSQVQLCKGFKYFSKFPSSRYRLLLSHQTPELICQVRWAVSRHISSTSLEPKVVDDPSGSVLWNNVIYDWSNWTEALYHYKIKLHKRTLRDVLNHWLHSGRLKSLSPLLGQFSSRSQMFIRSLSTSELQWSGHSILYDHQHKAQFT